MQINIKFTSAVYEYIIGHEYILLLWHCRNTGHTGFTFIQSFPAGFIWSLPLVETAYSIVNMIQVINKEARAT